MNSPTIPMEEALRIIARHRFGAGPWDVDQQRATMHQLKEFGRAGTLGARGYDEDEHQDVTISAASWMRLRADAANNALRPQNDTHWRIKAGWITQIEIDAGALRAALQSADTGRPIERAPEQPIRKDRATQATERHAIIRRTAKELGAFGSTGERNAALRATLKWKSGLSDPAIRRAMAESD